MSEIEYRSSCSVELIAQSGDDVTLESAAQVLSSTRFDAKWEEYQDNQHKITADKRCPVLRYCMKHKHGTPFEHGMFTFNIAAPIFVWREFHRHRIGFSYNEQSARYKPMKPVFWIPDLSRPVYPVENWKPMRPKFETFEEAAKANRLAGTWGSIDEGMTEEDFVRLTASEHHEKLCETLKRAYTTAWSAYAQLIADNGTSDPSIALEVARTLIPFGIYSSCWVTCNPRSLMHFLSLRIHDPNATYVSYPQYEIQEVAQKMEAFFKDAFPVTHEAFVEGGRVAP